MLSAGIVRSRLSLFLAPAVLAFLLSSVGCDVPQTEQRKASPESVIDAVRSGRSSATPIGKDISTPESSPSFVPDANAANLDAGSKEQVESPTVAPNLAPTVAPTESQNLDSTTPILGLNEVKEIAKPKRMTFDAPSGEWVNDLKLPSEQWELIYLGNRPVGYSHKKIQSQAGLDGEAIKIELISSTRIVRDGIAETQIIQLRSFEKRDGQVLRIEGSLRSGAISNRFEGRVESESLKLDVSEQGKLKTIEIPWDKEMRGPFAVEQSLLRRPIEKDEIRTVRYLDPVVGRTVEVQMETKSRALTPTMMNGSMNLQEIDIRPFGATDDANKSTLWTDDKGIPYKTHFSSKNVRVFRVPADQAIEFARTSEFLSVANNVAECLLDGIDMDQAVFAARNNNAIQYKVIHTEQDPFLTVSRKGNQSVKSIDARTALVRVHRTGADRTNVPNSGQAAAPVEFALAETKWIPWTSTEWSTFVERVKTPTEPADAPIRQRAIQLRDALKSKMSIVPWNGVFRPSSVVVQSDRCNSIEATLVLGQLLRFEKIPCQMALGVRLVQNKSALTWIPDMWVEYYDVDQWNAMSVVEDVSDACVDRIRLKSVDFADSKLLDELTTVAKWCENAKISISQE